MKWAALRIPIELELDSKGAVSYRVATKYLLCNITCALLVCLNRLKCLLFFVNIAELKGKRLDNFGEWVEKCSITSVGIQNFMELHKIKTPVYTCPANCHYSWPKGGTLLGLGSDALIPISLDIDFRQDVTGR